MNQHPILQHTSCERIAREQAADHQRLANSHLQATLSARSIPFDTIDLSQFVKLVRCRPRRRRSSFLKVMSKTPASLHHLHNDSSTAWNCTNFWSSHFTFMQYHCFRTSIALFDSLPSNIPFSRHHETTMLYYKRTRLAIYR